MFKGTILDQELYDRIYTDPDFAKTVLNFDLLRMYETLRESTNT